MLELSQVTHQATTVRMQYQCIRHYELDLIKSILHDENELAQMQLIAIDMQISSLQNSLEDGEVPVAEIGRKGPGCIYGYDPAWGESSLGTHEESEAPGTNSIIESESVVSGCVEDE
jgi:hypothetical protein